MLLRRTYKVVGLILVIFLLTTIITGTSGAYAAQTTYRITYKYTINFTYPGSCSYKIINESPYKIVIKYPEIEAPKKIVETPSKPEVPDLEDKPADSAFLSQDEQNMVNLVNSERLKAGLSPLKTDANLVKLARMKSSDMINKNYFDHYSPTYGSPFDMMKDHNLEFRSAGENIAGNKTVEGAFKAWMKKEGNKSNILNPDYKYIGIGICKSDRYGKVFVQQFIGN